MGGITNLEISICCSVGITLFLIRDFGIESLHVWRNFIWSDIAELTCDVKYELLGLQYGV